MQKILSLPGDNKVCALAVIIKNNKTLLGLRHYEEISLWISPGGRSEIGEHLEDTLRREVREEIGVSRLTIKKYLGELEGSNSDDKVFAFLCDIHEKERLVEPDKFEEWGWFDKEQVKKLPMNENSRNLLRSLLK